MKCRMCGGHLQNQVSYGVDSEVSKISMISYHMADWSIISYYVVSYHIVDWSIISYYIISYHIILYRRLIYRIHFVCFYIEGYV